MLPENKVDTLTPFSLGDVVLDCFPHQTPRLGKVVLVEGNYYTVTKADGSSATRSRLWLSAVDETEFKSEIDKLLKIFQVGY